MTEADEVSEDEDEQNKSETKAEQNIKKINSHQSKAYHKAVAKEMQKSGNAVQAKQAGRDAYKKAKLDWDTGADEDRRNWRRRRHQGQDETGADEDTRVSTTA